MTRRSAPLMPPNLPWSEPDLEFQDRLGRMPKVELHVHLEGALSADTVWMLAERNRLRLPVGSVEQWREHYEFLDFNHFIEIYDLATSAIQTAEDFTYIVERFCAEQAAQNIRHSEVLLSASLHLHKLSAAALADALAEGARRGQAAHAVSLYFLPDISRHAPATAREVLNFVLIARKRHPELFVGLQLAGKEEGFPAELFTDVYSEARQAGLHVVAHGGETTGPASVRCALEVLHVERIGHGIRCLDDPALVTLLRERQIPLEVCPVSNYRTKVLRMAKPHPLRRMVDEGLICTVNSDDPSMFATTLTGDYVLLAAQGFTWEELWKLNCNSLTCSFLSETSKQSLRMDWNEFARAVQST